MTRAALAAAAQLGQGAGAPPPALGSRRFSAAARPRQVPSRPSGSARSRVWPSLASVGSAAPFVGLFGTVWGIYHALLAKGRRARQQSGQGGGPVGEALIMTGVGSPSPCRRYSSTTSSCVANRLTLADRDAVLPMTSSPAGDRVCARLRQVTLPAPSSPSRGAAIMALTVAESDDQPLCRFQIDPRPIDVVLGAAPFRLHDQALLTNASSGLPGPAARPRYPAQAGGRLLSIDGAGKILERQGGRRGDAAHQDERGRPGQARGSEISCASTSAWSTASLPGDGPGLGRTCQDRLRQPTGDG